jgi:hypothetical protein
LRASGLLADIPNTFGREELQTQRTSRALSSSKANPSLNFETQLEKLRRGGYRTEMKIHFGFTVAGDRSGIKAARRIAHLPENLGRQVLNGPLG